MCKNVSLENVVWRPGCFFQDLVFDFPFVHEGHQAVGVLLGPLLDLQSGIDHLGQALVLGSGLSHHLVVVEQAALPRLLWQIGRDRNVTANVVLDDPFLAQVGVSLPLLPNLNAQS